MTPDRAESHFSQGRSLQVAGKLDAAIAEYRRALELRPDYLDAYFFLGHTLAARGMMDEAADSFRRVLQINPKHTGALNNLGNTLLCSGKPAEAAEIFRRILAIEPQYVMAHNNLSAALYAIGEFEEAAEAARRAIAARPEYPAAYRNLGDALGVTGHWSEAAENYKKMIDLELHTPPDPSAASEARMKLGLAKKYLGKMDEAVQLFRESVALAPKELEPLGLLADTLWEMGSTDEAFAVIQQAAKIHSGACKMHNTLAVVLLERGEVAEAIKTFAKAVELCPANPVFRSNKVFACMFHPDYDSARLRQEAEQWSNAHTPPKNAPVQHFQRHVRAATSPTDQKLRIGYVSSSFRDHVIAQNILPLLRDRDRSQFEIFCYSDSPRFDAVYHRLRGYSDHWRDILAISDDRAASQIRSDNLDILVDLDLHVGRNRLPVFGYRPAPVQVTFAGYPGTTGVAAMDYRLTDPYLDPPGMHDADYTERSIRLPHSFWCYDPDAMDVANLPEPGPPPAVAAGYVTFGCLNNFRKVSDISLQLWAKVMQRVPSSRLLILSPRGSHRNVLIQKMSGWGVAPERIGFIDRGPRSHYLSSYQRIDIALDTVPYNGHTTSLDAMWQGVPVVSIIGQTVVGRAGWSQACNLDLKDLVAHSDEQFVEIAAALAADTARLTDLHRTLRKRMRQSPICDAIGWTRGIETAYRQMWTTWCESQNPKPQDGHPVAS